MSEVIGKTECYEICCTLDECDKIESSMSDHTDDLKEVYRSSEWTLDEDGDVIARYVYRTTYDCFGRFSKQLDSKQYYELIRDMELIEF